MCHWAVGGNVRQKSPAQAELSNPSAALRATPHVGLSGHKQTAHAALWSRNGRDWSVEFVAITAAVFAGSS